MKQKGMSLEDCIRKAQWFISEQGGCLLLFDVKDSKKFKDRQELNNQLLSMMKDLNQKFGNYFPKHDLAMFSREEKGFQHLLGDASWTCINSDKAIAEIMEYQKTNYPNIPVYWSIARDGFDEEGIEMVR